MDPITITTYRACLEIVGGDCFSSARDLLKVPFFMTIRYSHSYQRLMKTSPAQAHAFAAEHLAATRASKLHDPPIKVPKTALAHFMSVPGSVMGLCLGPLLLVDLTASSDALQDLLPVLVELELGDFDLGRCDANWDGLAVGLLARDTLDVHNILQAVDGGDLSLAALVAAALDNDLIVLADRDSADLHWHMLVFGAFSLDFGRIYVVLLAQFCKLSAFHSFFN